MGLTAHGDHESVVETSSRLRHSPIHRAHSGTKPAPAETLPPMLARSPPPIPSRVSLRRRLSRLDPLPRLLLQPPPPARRVDTTGMWGGGSTRRQGRLSPRLQRLRPNLSSPSHLCPCVSCRLDTTGMRGGGSTRRQGRLSPHLHRLRRGMIEKKRVSSMAR